MHLALVFALFASLLKSIDAIPCLINSVPDQIRLAFAGDRGVSVGWHSYSCLLQTTNPNPNPTVIYGLSKTNLNKTSVNGDSSADDTHKILRTSWFYSVELLHLKPSTVYYYQIKQFDHVLASDILSFTLAPSIW